MVTSAMLDNYSQVEPSNAAEIFTLKIEGAESLTTLCSLVGDLCGRIDAHAGPSIAVVELQGGHATIPWPGNITVQDANRWERAIRRLEHCCAIVITTARGECGGAALDFLVASDFRLASPSFHLCLPVNKGQFWPGMNTYRLVQQIGIVRARQIVLSEHSMTAERCLSLGLIDELTDDIKAIVDGVVSRIERQDGAEMAIRRRLLLEATSAPYDEALGTHLAACDRELRRLGGAI